MRKFLPRVHQSTGFPYPSFMTISGARYSGVPQILLASLVPVTFILLSPKSVILMYPL